MKKIFVSLAEFTANGGELKNGRQLFKWSEHVNTYTPGWFFNPREVDPTSTTKYVQIDCTPHYH